MNPSPNVTVTAQFKVKPEKRQEALALMKSLTEATNAQEAGCISYYYLQNSTDECEFTSYEVWKSAQDEAKHWETAHVKQALQAMPDMLQTFPNVVKWKSIA